MILKLTLRPGESEEKLKNICSRKLHAPCNHFEILKKSLDARDKGDIRWVYSVECAAKQIPRKKEVLPQIFRPIPRIYIAGAGPAGLFCALRLVEHGIRPVILERGKRVEERERDILDFIKTGRLDPSSNVQFGEGGAGAFSDGKLNTQTNGPHQKEILETFVRFGAPKEVSYLSKPHVGSDNLKIFLKNLRAYLLENGVEFRFSSCLTDVFLRDGKLHAIAVNGKKEDAEMLVLAVGHSARDTFEMLCERGFLMEQKEFAVGVRVEHLQEKINFAQYGDLAPLLPPADYKLASHASDRAVFTFCMCPGGIVIPSASEEGRVVTNGMSNFLRNERNANSALIAQVKREDFSSEHPLAGISFQRNLEEAAYLAGGGDFRAPVQRMGDFLERKNSSFFGEVLPSYGRGTGFAPVDSYLPAALCDALRAAVPDLERRLKGFSAQDALLTGVESRTSSPLRVLRGEDLQAVGKEGIYPCGEGCGYAGGISSAAGDGIRVAESIFARLSEMK